MKKNHLLHFIAEQTGGKVVSMNIAGTESEVVVGSTVSFPSPFSSISQSKSFWDGWEKEYQRKQQENAKNVLVKPH